MSLGALPDSPNRYKVFKRNASYCGHEMDRPQALDADGNLVLLPKYRDVTKAYLSQLAGR